MSILTFTGTVATTLALFTNRQAEVQTRDGWRTANSQAETRRFLQQSSDFVRLRIGDRVLLEDILKRAIPVDTVLADFIASIDPSILSAEQSAALTLVKGAM